MTFVELLRTSIHDNRCDLTIKSDTEQQVFNHDWINLGIKRSNDWINLGRDQTLMVLQIHPCPDQLA